MGTMAVLLMTWRIETRTGKDEEFGINDIVDDAGEYGYNEVLRKMKMMMVAER